MFVFLIIHSKSLFQALVMNFQSVLVVFMTSLVILSFTCVNCASFCLKICLQDTSTQLFLTFVVYNVL